LFIDNDGNIFHTFKKEEDFWGNIYEECFDGVKLYERIRNSKIKTMEFVDFEYYSASDESTSFFIYPVLENNKELGFIVLELPIKDINSILADRKKLGRTGEVYLVNYKQLMITQSRFIDDNTILNKQINTEAIRNALKEKKGNKIIEDYRGKRVFSSYEQFDYEGAKWIITAEIDEDEVYENIGFVTRILFKDRCTNFVDTVMYDINRYNITQFGKSFLHFGIFATHNSSFKKIIDKLIGNGIELSQIKILFKDNYNLVNVIFNYSDDQIWSNWGKKGNNMIFTNEYKHVADSGEIVKRLHI